MSVIPTIAPFFLPRILPRLRKERPALKLFLREETSADAIRVAPPRDARIACCWPSPLPRVMWISSILPTTRFMLPFPKTNPPIPPASIPPSMIDEGQLLLLEDGHCLKEHALAACNRPELSSSATMIGTSLHTLVQMVDNGLGMTMLPQMAIDTGILNDTEVIARPIKAENPSREIALVWRKSSPREDEFKLLAEELRAG